MLQKNQVLLLDTRMVVQGGPDVEMLSFHSPSIYSVYGSP